MISQIGSSLDGTPSSSFFHAKRLLQGGDAAGSLAILDTLSAANQDDAAFVHVHGIAQFRNTQNANAVASLTRAVSLSPNDKGFAEDLAAVEAAIADAEVAAAEAAAAGK
jgi:Flp pilus assembly protein TadD